MYILPTPHGDKLNALLENEKLPETDRPRILEAGILYKKWLENLKSVSGRHRKIVVDMVDILNEYKQYVELNVIFDSEEDFLYRQKGQLKLDNTIIEEFLPILLTSTLSDLLQDHDLDFGPMTCFSGIRFESSIKEDSVGGGMRLRNKDHDFAISRRLFVRSSYYEDFHNNLTEKTNIAYVAAECKTNLDKTMFQEAAATALDVKFAVPGAKYYLLCEWLDMSPISTNTTAIDEILILRKAKRLSSEVRRAFSSVGGRKENRGKFVQHLEHNPFSAEMFLRFSDHVRKIVEESPENDIITRGYF
ncbi:Bpu10I family restriction endonuclease [Candidatus Poribacteria bacterium]|nr:MAG: Bpu10I family restriction endonuclease [Candidatus Poribacteria bacterium]